MLASAYDLNVPARALGVILFAAAVLAPASAGQQTREGPGIRADIDGDGAPDRLIFTRRADHFTMRVTTRRGPTTLTVRGFSGPQASSSGVPHVVALRPMNRRPGLEVQVLTWESASREWLVFYTWHRGRLVPMAGGPHDPAEPRYVWTVGGTVGTGYETADCIATQTIGVHGSYRDVRRRWVSTAARYDVLGTRFVRTADYRRVTNEIPNSNPRGWPRLKNRDFKSCGGTVVDRKRR
jgi:hypothetical protein